MQHAYESIFVICPYLVYICYMAIHSPYLPPVCDWVHHTSRLSYRCRVLCRPGCPQECCMAPGRGRNSIRCRFEDPPSCRRHTFVVLIQSWNYLCLLCQHSISCSVIVSETRTLPCNMQIYSLHDLSFCRRWRQCAPKLESIPEAICTGPRNILT